MVILNLFIDYLVRGAVDPRGGYVSKILHVKMKESGPVGGGAPPPLDPPMLFIDYHYKSIVSTIRERHVLTLHLSTAN